MKSDTHGQCDTRPTVTFSAAEPLTDTKLYCLITRATCRESRLTTVGVGNGYAAKSVLVQY